MSVIHQCEIGMGAVTSCCGRSPFELPRTDRMTLERSQATCTGTPPMCNCGHTVYSHRPNECVGCTGGPCRSPYGVGGEHS